ncbi:hypothetical protein [Microcoleus sp. herbarium14]|uniref:hypothetical protein n=1 Tax=Microcoleus sp. herbarium14 TaxID=3055439 RepID=UPI002FD4A845
MAAKHYLVKEAFADWDVLKDIAKEVKGKGEVSNDLTRWAAASALEAIGYSQQSLQHLEGGGFTEPLDRIRREIRDRKFIEINRIPRLNSRGETTAEYERHLEFWIYGPVEELFAGNDHSPNYQGLVKDVIRELHGRGVYLGLISPNLLVQAEALLQAGSIFKESAEIENFLYPFLEDFLHNPNQEISFRINAAEIIHTARDLSRRLKTLSKLLLEEKNTQLQEWTLGKTQSLFKQSAENEKFLYQPLEEFLLNSSRQILLRINAAEIISTSTDLNRRLKTLSKLLLEEKNPKLQEVALRQSQSLFKLSAEIEAFIYGLLEEFLFDRSNEVSLRIDTAEIINTATNLSKKLTTLSKLLLEEIGLRNTSVRLLIFYKQELASYELDSYTLLDALNFEYKLDQSEPKELTISEIDNRLSSVHQLQGQIKQKFVGAVAAAAALAIKYRRSALVVTKYLQNQEFEIENWIQKLNRQKAETATEQSKIASNQLILKKYVLSSHFKLKCSGSEYEQYLAQLDQWNKIKNIDHQNFFGSPAAKEMIPLDTTLYPQKLKMQKALLLNPYENFTYNDCKKNLSDLLDLKNEIIFILNQDKDKKITDEVPLGDNPLVQLLLIVLLPFFTFVSFVNFGILTSVFLLFVIISMIILTLKYFKNKKIEKILRRLNEQWRE